MSDPYRQIVYGLLALAATAVTGVVGYVELCGWSLGDAVYMLIITISTVGYAEIGPESPWTRWVSVYVIVLGIASFTYTFGGLVRMLTEGEIQRAITQQLQSRRIEHLRDYHIVCGFGRMGAMICQELERRGEHFVLIERDPERLGLADQQGYLFIQGDATEEEVLTRAGIERAKSLVCVLPSDADNIFTTLTGRNMNPKLLITARSEQLTTEKKLLQAGANRVVSPPVIGAQRVVNMLTRPTTFEILELVTGRQSIDLEMNEIQIPGGGAIHGQTLAQAEIRKRTGVIVVAIKQKDGKLVINPDSDVPLHEEDTVVILGRRENIDSFRRQFAS